MKFTLIAGVAAVAALSCSAAVAQSQCPPSDISVTVAPEGASAANVYDDARDTAALVQAARYARVSDTGQIYRWRVVKYAWPRGDYDAIYGPGAYRQNYELEPHADYPY
jgi:hypothetical protein